MSTRTRLCLGFLLIAGLGFYFLVDWLVDDLRPRYLETMEASMLDTATLLAASLSDQAGQDGIDIGDLRGAFERAGARRFHARIYEEIKTRLGLRVYVIDKDGTVLFDSEGVHEGADFSQWNDVIRTLRGEYGARTTRTDPEDPNSSVLHVASPVMEDGEVVGVLTVAKPSASINNFLDSAKRKIVLGGLLAAVAVGVLGVAASAWITRPIRKLTGYARAVRDGGKPTPPRLGRSEIGELGAAFEEMRDALEGRQYVENYVQTLTHEMKGPLAAVQGAAELLEEEMPTEARSRFLRNIRNETARIRQLADRMLTLASLEGRKGLREVEDIDLAALAADVEESLEPLLASGEIALVVQVPQNAHLRGERFLLRQSLVNVLHNAVEFSPDGGRVELVAEVNEDAVTIRVRDSGPGIPAYALTRVFDRFYSLERPGTNRRSTGLGLTFVREAIQLHDGSVRVRNRPDGGAEVVIVLPLTPADGPA